MRQFWKTSLLAIGLAAPAAAHDGHASSAVSAKVVAADVEGQGVSLRIDLVAMDADIDVLGVRVENAMDKRLATPLHIPSGHSATFSTDVEFDGIVPGIFTVTLRSSHGWIGPVLAISKSK